MSFPLPLAAKLTGTTAHQLRSWRTKGLVVPEIRPWRPPLYSFRDLILLRTMAYLRAETSLQRISKAFGNLNTYDLMEHPSSYRFGTDGVTVFVELPEGQALDLVTRPGQLTLFTFAEIAGAFQNFHDVPVAPFATPAPHLELRPRRLGGWPTIEGTRVPYDVVARLVDFDNITPEDVSDVYPGVSASAAMSAVDFDREVRAIGAA